MKDVFFKQIDSFIRGAISDAAQQRDGAGHGGYARTAIRMNAKIPSQAKITKPPRRLIAEPLCRFCSTGGEDLSVTIESRFVHHLTPGEHCDEGCVPIETPCMTPLVLVRLAS